MKNPEEYTPEEIKKLYGEALERVELLLKKCTPSPDPGCQVPARLPDL